MRHFALVFALACSLLAQACDKDKSAPLEFLIFIFHPDGNASSGRDSQGNDACLLEVCASGGGAGGQGIGRRDHLEGAVKGK